MPAEKKAVIVGAGLVGALWSVILARRGYRVEVFEQRPDFREAGYIGGRSINLALSERGWKAVEIAGIREKIEAVALPMPGRMMHGLDGKLTFQPYGKKGQAIYSVSRGGLNIELVRIADEFENVRFHFNQRCLGVDLNDHRIRFEDLKTGEISTLNDTLIFGTDGAFSAVRQSLQRLPRFNYSQQYIEHGYKELCIPPAPDGSHRMDKGALHIWPRGQFMLIALPNLDGSFTCTLFLPFDGEESFENLQTEAKVIGFFKKYFPDTLSLMPTLTEDFFENPTSALVTVRCHPWHYGSRVLLLGDAAHAIVPFFGQGMNCGFEDCTILDSLMDKYDEDWKPLIEEFNASRPEDANAIADLALMNFIEMRDKVGDPRFLLWKKIEAYLHERFPTEFQSVYSMVSFSHTPYSEALATVASHERLFNNMLDIPNLNEQWDAAAVEGVFRAWL
jgi:kynurenine 3-monooxygenase